MTQAQDAPADNYLIVKGLRLHYLEWGRPNSPALVLLHGRTGFAHSWDKVGEFFKDRYHVVAPDLRGHGESDWDPQASYDMDTFVSDLTGLLGQLKLPPFLLVGHSMGANVALHFAARYPEWVKKLVLEDGGPVGEALAKSQKERVPPPLTFSSWPEAEQALRQQYAAITSGENFTRWTQLALKEQAGGTIGWRADMARLMDTSAAKDAQMKEGAWEAVERLQCPTLLIQAGNNPLLEPDVATRMLAMNPQIRLVVIPDSWHNVHGTQFEEYVRTVSSFLAEP